MINGVTVLSSMMLGVVAAIGMTNEFTHNTIRPTFAAQPRRLVPLLAKLVVHLALAAVVMVVIIVVSWLLGSLLGDGSYPLTASAFGSSVSAVPPLIGAGLLGIGLTILGFGLGMLVRNAPATICILLLWPLIAESLISVLFAAMNQDDLVKFLPYVEGINMGAWEPGSDMLGRVPGGLYFFAWVLVIAVLGLWRTDRTDA
jgi:ABC-2 type transport system permease protein